MSLYSEPGHWVLKTFDEPGHWVWEAFDKAEARKQSATEGIPIEVDWSIPPDKMLFVSPRRLNETEEDWARRCVVIKGIGGRMAAQPEERGSK